MKKTIAGLAVFALSTCLYADALLVTVSGTVDNYAEAFTVSMTLNQDWDNSSSSGNDFFGLFGDFNNVWGVQTTSEGTIISGLTGDIFTGTYSNAGDPYEWVGVSLMEGNGSFEFYAGAGSSDIGLSYRGQLLDGVKISGDYSGAIPYSDSYYPLVNCLSVMQNGGTFGNPLALTLDYAGSETAIFGTINSISIAAVPEPATFVLFGIFGAGIFGVRRRFML